MAGRVAKPTFRMANKGHQNFGLGGVKLSEGGPLPLEAGSCHAYR
jgi:hypothetical protein